MPLQVWGCNLTNEDVDKIYVSNYFQEEIRVEEIQTAHAIRQTFDKLYGRMTLSDEKTDLINVGLLYIKAKSSRL